MEFRMLSPSEVTTVAKECDRVLAAPKGALWTDDELVVIWEGERPIRLWWKPTHPEEYHRHLGSYELARSEPSHQVPRMLVALARTFDGALREWADLLLEEVKVGAE
jgi:hypothetical protein